MLPTPELPTTSVLFIDGNDTDRAFYADGLKRCSRDYRILEAADVDSGLALYQSQRVDCVVLELSWPDRSGFEILLKLVPLPSRPNIAVIILTKLGHRGLFQLAKRNGAYVYLIKRHTSGEDLDRVIRRAVAFIGRMPKGDQYRAL